MNLVPLNLDRKLALRKSTSRLEVAGFALAGLHLFDPRGDRGRRLEILVRFAPGVADGRLILERVRLREIACLLLLLQDQRSQ